MELDVIRKKDEEVAKYIELDNEFLSKIGNQDVF